MLTERKTGVLPACNSGFIVCVQPNFGPMIQVDNASVRITKDLTRGTLVVKLIRNRIDKSIMEECIEIISRREQERSRITKQLTAMLDKFNYRFDREEKGYIVSELCKFTGKSSFLEVSEDKNGSVFMLLHSGTASLSDIIANTGRSFYLDGESQIKDLVMAQKFAEINRIGTLKRLFGAYYDTTRLEECVLSVWNFSYHTIVPDRVEIRLAVQKPGRSTKLLLINIKDGAMLYQSEEKYAPSGCGRKITLNQTQLRNPFYVEAAKASLRGIYHS